MGEYSSTKTSYYRNEYYYIIPINYFALSLYIANKCNECTVIFKSEQDLSQHKKIYHPKISNKYDEPLLRLEDDDEEVEEHDIIE